jgi:hypothetical protein
MSNLEQSIVAVVLVGALWSLGAIFLLRLAAAGANRVKRWWKAP